MDNGDSSPSAGSIGHIYKDDKWVDKQPITAATNGKDLGRSRDYDNYHLDDGKGKMRNYKEVDYIIR